MLVQRQVMLNPVEAAVLSMRVPVGMAVDLALAFVKVDAQPVDYDPFATLYLTGRSDDTTLEYPVVSTDVTNGKGTATIPADTLDDPNGYRVRLTGTIAGQATLIGMGTVRLIDGP